LLYPTTKFDLILKKILETNETLPNSIYYLDEAEVIYLKELIQKISVQEYDCSFHPIPLFLVTAKLLQWPEDKLFPIIDMTRILILHRKAGVFYIKVSESGNMFEKLFKILENSSYENTFCTLKFLCNMFSNPPTRVVLRYYQNQIMEVLYRITNSTFDENQTTNIKTLIVNIILNFTKMWKCRTDPMKTEVFQTKKLALQILIFITNTTQDTKLRVKALSAFGTILQYDFRINSQTRDLEDVLLPLITDSDPAISSCAQYIEHLNSLRE